MPDVTDILTNTEVSAQVLVGERPDVLVNIGTGIQAFVDPQVATISVSRGIWPDDGSSDVVTVTILDSLLNPVNGRTIKLHTKPSGKTGDNATNVTNSSGQAAFNVSSTIFGFIVYTFSDVTP